MSGTVLLVVITSPPLTTDSQGYQTPTTLPTPFHHLHPPVLHHLPLTAPPFTVTLFVGCQGGTGLGRPAECDEGSDWCCLFLFIRSWRPCPIVRGRVGYLRRRTWRPRVRRPCSGPCVRCGSRFRVWSERGRCVPTLVHRSDANRLQRSRGRHHVAESTTFATHHLCHLPPAAHPRPTTDLPPQISHHPPPTTHHRHHHPPPTTRHPPPTTCQQPRSFFRPVRLELHPRRRARSVRQRRPAASGSAPQRRHPPLASAALARRPRVRRAASGSAPQSRRRLRSVASGQVHRAEVSLRSELPLCRAVGCGVRAVGSWVVA